MKTDFRIAVASAEHLPQVESICSTIAESARLLFSITTSQAVMNLNSQVGFQPVAFSQLPQEERFWSQCATCQNCDILARTGRKYCLCTGMLYDPGQPHEN